MDNEPERIWLAHAGTAREYDVPITERVKPRNYPFPATEYVHADTADAMALAAVEAALREAAKALNDRGQQEQINYGLGRETQNFYRSRDIVRALIPSGPSALDRAKADSEARGMERAAKIASSYDCHGYGDDSDRTARDIAAAIRRPMGVVPASAEELVTTAELNEAETRRAAIRAQGKM